MILGQRLVSVHFAESVATTLMIAVAAERVFAVIERLSVDVFADT